MQRVHKCRECPVNAMLSLPMPDEDGGGWRIVAKVCDAGGRVSVTVEIRGVTHCPYCGKKVEG